MPLHTQFSMALMSGQYKELPQYLQSSVGTIRHDFESETPWAVQSNINLVDDTTYVAQGSQALRFTCTIAGTVGLSDATIAQTFFTISDNMSIRAYIHDLTALTNIIFYLSEDAVFSNFYFKTVAASVLKVGWNVIDLKKSLWSVGGGTPSWSNQKVRFRIRLTPVSGQIGDVTFDRLEEGGTFTPAVLLNLDDGNDSDYLAYRYMNTRSVHATHYVVSGLIGNSGYLTTGQLQEMAAGGQAIGNHTVTHTNLTTLTQPQTETELTGCQTFLGGIGLDANAKHVAYPYGAANSTTSAAMTATGMLTGRNVGGLLYDLRFVDLYGIQSIPIDASVSLVTAKGYIDSAISQQRVCTLLLHQLVESSPTGGQWSYSDFYALVDYIIQQRIQPLTVADLYALRSSSRTVRQPW